MNGNDINTVVDNLCEKLGTAKEMLVPELAKMCSMRYLCNSVFCIVVLIALIVILCRYRKIIENRRNYDFDTEQNAEIGAFVCSIATIGFFIGLWYNAYECIQWLAAPTAKAFEYILTLLKV